MTTQAGSLPTEEQEKCEVGFKFPGDPGLPLPTLKRGNRMKLPPSCEQTEKRSQWMVPLGLKAIVQVPEALSERARRRME